MATSTERLNGISVTRYKGKMSGEETIFIPLPVELWRSCDGCECALCKSDGGPGYWDTLAVSAKAPKRGHDFTYTVHYPELHCPDVRRAKVAADAEEPGPIASGPARPV